jgi:hypothetical protein
MLSAGSSRHCANFVEAIRSGGNQGRLHCDIEVGVRSSTLPLIANIAYRLKTDLKFDGHKEQFIGNVQANAMLKRDDRQGYVVPKIGRERPNG